MKKKLNLLFLVALVFLPFIACVKDTDLDQTDDIVVSPVIELDFLFFTIDSESFENSNIGIGNLTVTDTTEFSFLNDDFSSDNLIRAEFYFKYTNGLPLNFITEYQFLDEDNELHYEIIIPVNAGSVDSPLITEHIENIEGDRIIDLKNSEKVVVNIIAPSSVDNLEGTLNLQSKTTYYLSIEQ